jgi:signal peptidase I
MAIVGLGVAVTLLVAAGILVWASKDLYVVTSGSMAPTFNPGDVLYIQHVDPATLKVGDIITFQPPTMDELVTHRIYALHADGFETKGDHNAQPDKWRIQPSEVKGTLDFRIPHVGLYLSDIRSTGIGFLLVSVPLVVLCILQSRMVVTEWKRWRRHEGPAAI